jgi:hypothetical protein
VACGIWWTQKTGVTIYGTWTIGIVVSVLVLLGMTVRTGLPARQWRPEVRIARDLSRRALDPYFDLALQMSPLILPLLATNLLVANASAALHSPYHCEWRISAAIRAFGGSLCCGRW